MTPERSALVGKLLVAAPWLGEERANVLIDGTPEEQLLIVQSQATAAVTEGPEVWQKILSILSAVAGTAGSVTGISNAIKAVYAL